MHAKDTIELANKKYFGVTIFLFCSSILLTFLVANKDKYIYELDHLVFSFLSVLDANGFSDSIIVTNIILLSLLYGEDYFWSFVMVILFFFAGKEGRYIVFILLVSYLLLVPLGFLSKDIIKRERPSLESDATIHGKLSFTNRERTQYSYPSGHAIIVSTGAFVVVFHLLFRYNHDYNNHYRNYNAKKNAIAILLVSVFLVIESIWVCFVQIVVKAHYMTDILAGIILGTGISLSVILCFGKPIRRLQDLLSNIPLFSLFENYMDNMVRKINGSNEISKT
ncbi:MAG: phosphatase PAP2 family protein [Thermoproteota archaeon]|nr:phosphatase PAP2 family protein [Thermoproteota archaeon]